MGVAEPQPTTEDRAVEPAVPVATEPAGPSDAPLDAATVAALADQLRALEAEPHATATPPPELPDRPCAASFCVRVVDDDADPLRELERAALPAGARVEEVAVPAGLPGGARTLRMQLVVPASATPAQLAELARLATPHLPPRRELAWGRRQSAPGAAVLESYLVGPAVIDAADVARSERTLFEGGVHAVAMELQPDGAKRFGEVTAKLVYRRLAILSAGSVQSAPIVQSAIGGGRVSVSFPSEAEADAFQRLLVPSARSMRGR